MGMQAGRGERTPAGGGVGVRPSGGALTGEETFPRQVRQGSGTGALFQHALDNRCQDDFHGKPHFTAGYHDRIAA